MLFVEDSCYVTQPGNDFVGSFDQREIKRKFVVLQPLNPIYCRSGVSQ